MPNSSDVIIANGKEIYKRLLGYVKPYWKAFIFAIIGMVIGQRIRTVTECLLLLLESPPLSTFLEFLEFVCHTVLIWSPLHWSAQLLDKLM